MKIHETTEDDGSLAPIRLEREGDALYLVKKGERLLLPSGALAAVMGRMGRALDPGARIDEVARLETVDGVLRHVRHLDTFDVIARDWLVLDPRGGVSACALATTVAGALEHLARALAAR